MGVTEGLSLLGESQAHVYLRPNVVVVFFSQSLDVEVDFALSIATCSRWRSRKGLLGLRHFDSGAMWRVQVFVAQQHTHGVSAHLRSLIEGLTLP